MKKLTLFFGLIIFIFGVSMSTNAKEKSAYFAGGCFWCMEPPFEQLVGVKKVESGYMGGDTESPTYEEVSSGGTGHAEIIRITYDNSLVTYEKLLEVFFMSHNPTDAGGQFADRGSQYRSAIFYNDDTEKSTAKKYIKDLDKKDLFKGKTIATTLEKSLEFTLAEDYHQDYYKKNPVKYKFYRYLSGRDKFLESTWNKGDNKKEEIKNKIPKNTVMPSEEELKKKLTPLQYNVTQKGGTEPAFKNKYWDNKKDGIYVDIVSGEPLFSSKDKYKSGTGWPSFTRPINSENITTKEDNTFFTTRTEIKSKKGKTHLGHVFKDGPQPTGLRYCVNSAALKFIPKENLKKEGYEKFDKLFD